MTNKFNLISCIALLVFALLGCADTSKNLNNSLPKEQNVNNIQTNTLEQKPVAKTYKSGGIGLERKDWEAKFGNGKPNVGNMVGYENDKYILQFSYSNPENITYIERVYGDANAVSISDARQESKRFISADAKFVKTYTSPSGSTVDLYKSESLKDRFSESDFINGESGDFIIIYRNQTGKTTTFIIAIGNNP
jgi:hypothetical protein